MNILFYKLLARKELQETVNYLMKSQDLDYSLENQIRADGYNAIEKLKELEDDLDAQLLTPEIYDLIKTNSIDNLSGLHDFMEYLEELDFLIKERFKMHGKFITRQIYEYLSKKEIDIEKVNDNIDKYTAKCVGTNKETLDWIDSTGDGHNMA